jgi:sterol desaturase/sphingolipid hydroxylase (fatty acid hydroxylase superfamily)
VCKACDLAIEKRSVEKENIDVNDTSENWNEPLPQHSAHAVDSDTWIRRLAYSKFNYWAGYVANLILIAWLVSRAIFGREEISLLRGMGLAALGFFIYTFTEYLFHRFLYHAWKSPFSKGHGLHHADPKGLLGLPWYFPYPVIIGVYYLLSWAFEAPGSVGILMGMWWFGFVAYCAVHHSIHHYNFKWGWFRELKAHHKVHHVKEETNFGVVSIFWDKIFGTHFVNKSESKLR